MIGLAEMGNVKTVIVKDMSRMGRNYLKVGYYTEIFLPRGIFGISSLTTALTAKKETMISPLSAICLTRRSHKEWLARQ